MTDYELWSLAVAAVSFGLNIAVFGLLYWQLRLLGRQVTDSRESLELATNEAAMAHTRARQQATLDFIASTIEKQHDLFGRLRNDPQFLDKAHDRDTHEYLILRDYLSYLEDLSVGVNMSIFDKEVVDRSIGGRIIRARFGPYAEWIEWERRELDSPRLYEELEYLAKELSAARSTVRGGSKVVEASAQERHSGVEPSRARVGRGGPQQS